MVHSISPALVKHPRLGAISRGCLAGLVAVGLVLLAGLACVGKYNSLQRGRTSVEARFGELDSQYKRRTDLIDNLVETVKGAADFEKSTLEEVTRARADVGRTQLPPGLPTDPAQLDAYLKAQQQLGNSLARLLVTMENYPQLRATERFGELQAQLEGTENRINAARIDYIGAVRDYDAQLRTFPGNVVGGLFGMKEIPQFTVEESQRAVPKVDFGKKQ
jgi:LemA protein